MKDIILRDTIVKVDIKDKKILYHLLNNCRQSYNSIGKKVGLSKDIVMYRTKRLEKEGVILNYRTLFRISTLGLSLVRFQYSLQLISPELKQEIMDHFIKSKCTQYVLETEGCYDLEVSVFTDNNNSDEFLTFYDETQCRYRQYFDEQTGAEFNKIEFFGYSYFLGVKDVKSYPRPNNPKLSIKIDDLDIKIIQILAENARIPTLEIAKELNVTVVTVKNRIKKLINGNVITGFFINIDWSKLGYRGFIVQINLKDYNKKNKIIEYVKKYPNLVNVNQTIGVNNDLDFLFGLNNITQLHEIIKNLSAKFPDSIKNFKYYSILKQHKMICIPQYNLKLER
jgi:Lrp/AsnC family transcriptional regulator for asnA, asnC and gidA